MLFSGERTNREFYTLYGGQIAGGIRTPKNLPFIYLIISKDTNDYKDVDSLDFGDNGEAPEFVRYAFVKDNEVTGLNLRVLNHDGRADNSYYKSLLLFVKENGRIRQIGEYRRIDVSNEYRIEHGEQVEAGVGEKEIDPRYGVNNNGRRYFLLQRTTDLDDVELKLVQYDSELESLATEQILSRREYIYRPERAERLENYAEFLDEIEIHSDVERVRFTPTDGISENDFVDANNQIVDLQSDTDEAKKAQQYLMMVQNMHIKLSRNNVIIDAEGNEIQYEPKLMPAIKFDNVFFYVVNVGWGLLQILVFSNDRKMVREAWVFDCGCQNKTYEKKILECLDDINENGKYTVNITKLFVSHPHDDHFTRYGLFPCDDKTEVWINPNVKYCNNKYYKFLGDIYISKCKMVEPCSYSTRGSGYIKILHPDGQLVLVKRAAKAPITIVRFNYVGPVNVLYTCYEKEENEICPIIQINVFDKKLYIPGDAMDRSWEYYCGSYSKDSADVYVHAHHGTTSGFTISGIAGVADETDIFYPIKYEFVSLKDKFRGWEIDTNLASHTGLFRTDDPTGTKFYKYDLKNDRVTRA